jgi:hypothetical protein
MPFATLTSTQLLITQAALKASTQHDLRVAFAPFDVSALTAGLQLIPDATSSSLWLAIGHSKSRSSENYAAFGDFTAALKTDLSGAVGVARVLADGPYDAASGALSVDQMIVLIDD